MRRRRLNAFTLIETIAAIVVLSIIASTAALLVGRIGASFRDRTTHDQLHLETSVALDRIVREVRAIECNDDGIGMIPEITAATTTALQWGAGQMIDLNGTQLRLNTDGTNTDALAMDVTALALDYQDESGSSLISGTSVPTIDLVDIQRIKVSLSTTRSGCTETLHTLVFLRSLTSPGAN